MTTFALTLWLYEKTGSALQMALLSVCSYAPYVVMSIFAGALSDRWDKKKVSDKETKESLFESAKSGLVFLKENPLILMLILLLAGVNFVASAFDAVLPVYIYPP